jgi:hypothetical protein
VFDNDGTLWPKNPLAFQLASIIDGLKRRALNDPTLTEDPTVRSVYFEPYIANKLNRRELRRRFATRPPASLFRRSAP